MVEILINETFSEDDDDFLDDSLENTSIESSELFDLRLEAESVSSDVEIKSIESYREIKKLLEFDLPHQKDGALRILRDMNGTGLLADEVGLGKTITAGIALKECIYRGFAEKTLILTPPSLVNQWVAELKEKFNLDFKIVETEKDWNESNQIIASIDRVKAF
ncbi:MAG: ATP-dependent helicase, partial [Nanoarchaeota archaeon]|nr:ATP-dependent helicase [Nanoarchaeota archaeon]